MFDEYDVILAKKELSKNVPENTKGTILICYGENSDAYEVEFMNAEGKTLDVLTVFGKDLELFKKFSSRQTN